MAGGTVFRWIGRHLRIVFDVPKNAMKGWNRIAVSVHLIVATIRRRPKSNGAFTRFYGVRALRFSRKLH